MMRFDGWQPIAERYDAASGLWATEHAREDGSRYVIVRPNQDAVFNCAFGCTLAEAVANWRGRHGRLAA